MNIGVKGASVDLTLVRSCLDLSGEKLLASISILLIYTMQSSSFGNQEVIQCPALLLSSRAEGLREVDKVDNT